MILAMDYRGFSSLRGRRGFGGPDLSNRILSRPYQKETDCRHIDLRPRGNAGRFHPRERFLPSNRHLTTEAQDQLYRLYHVWKPHWWICILPALGWVGVSSTFRSVSPGGGVFNCYVQSQIPSRSGLCRTLTSRLEYSNAM